MNYRILFGDGSLYGEYDSLSSAKRGMVEIIEYSSRYGQSTGGARIQQYLGYGDWGNVSASGRVTLDPYS